MMRKQLLKKKTYKFLYTIKGNELPGIGLPRKKAEINAKNESEAWKTFRKNFICGREYHVISLEIKGK